MGALKPWHMLTLLCLLLSVGGGVAGIIALIKVSTRPK